MIYPPNIIRRGDTVACNRWLGYAQEKLRLLEASMTSWIKQDSIIYRPEHGVFIKCVKLIGLSYIIIEVDKSVKRTSKKKLEPIVKDLRFFCRVGAPDALNGYNVDNTRYYWIDFGTLTGEDKINVYPVDIIFHTMLQHVVDVPTTQSQTKAFNLYSIDVNDASVTQRFVAGYHFLAQHKNNNSRELLLSGISPLTQDGAGTNRFLANLDDGTMCWGRVQQSWGLFSTYTDATGEISVYIYRVEYDTERNKWGLVSDSGTGFYLSASNVKYYITSDWNQLDMVEPVCLASDIYSISSDEIKVNLPYAHKAGMFTFSLEINETVQQAALIEAEEIDTLSRWKFTEEGFSRYECTSYFFGNTDAASDYDSWSETIHTSCTGHLTSGDCLEHNSPYLSSITFSYFESEDSVSKKSVTLDLAGETYEYLNLGWGRYQKSETINHSIPSKCEWGFGNCSATVGLIMIAQKSTDATMGGFIQTKPTGGTPGNNIDHVKTEYYEGGMTSFFREWNGSESNGATGTRFLDGSCSPYTPITFENFISESANPPCACTSPSLAHAELAIGTWPKDYPFDDACGAPLRNFASHLPDPTTSDGITWDGDVDPETGPTTTDVYSYTVDGVTYTGASIVYLDDRTTENTHGLCIAVKGNNIGDWDAITHGEDGITVVTRDKFADLVAALIAANFMSDTDVIHDIGLI